MRGHAAGLVGSVERQPRLPPHRPLPGLGRQGLLGRQREQAEVAGNRASRGWRGGKGQIADRAGGIVDRATGDARAHKRASAVIRDRDRADIHDERAGNDAGNTAGTFQLLVKCGAGRREAEGGCGTVGSERAEA